MWHNTQCKFCKCSITVEIDDSCSLPDVGKWLAKSACNRCADFHHNMWSLTDRLEKACVIWLQLVNSKTHEPHRKAFEEKLTALTKIYSNLCSRHYRVANAWSAELVESLIESPDRCRNSLRAYHRTYFKAAASQQPLPLSTAEPALSNP